MCHFVDFSSFTVLPWDSRFLGTAKYRTNFNTQHLVFILFGANQTISRLLYQFSQFFDLDLQVSGGLGLKVLHLKHYKSYEGHNFMSYVTSEHLPFDALKVLPSFKAFQTPELHLSSRNFRPWSFHFHTSYNTVGTKSKYHKG